MPKTHVVKYGDSLWQIAQSVYGKGELWPQIMAANKQVVFNEGQLIFIGTELLIPDIDTENSKATQSLGVGRPSKPSTPIIPNPELELNTDLFKLQFPVFIGNSTGKCIIKLEGSLKIAKNGAFPITISNNNIKLSMKRAYSKYRKECRQKFDALIHSEIKSTFKIRNFQQSGISSSFTLMGSYWDIELKPEIVSPHFSKFTYQTRSKSIKHVFDEYQVSGNLSIVVSLEFKSTPQRKQATMVAPSRISDRLPGLNTSTGRSAFSNQQRMLIGMSIGALLIAGVVFTIPSGGALVPANAVLFSAAIGYLGISKSYLDKE